MTASTTVQSIASIIEAIAPIIDIADPAIGAVLTAVTAILGGVAAAEPTAISLYNQITSGTTPTAAELTAYIAANETAFSALQADIAAKLAAEG